MRGLDAHVTGYVGESLEHQSTDQSGILGCPRLHYSSVPLCGRGRDTMINTAQTYLPQLRTSLSFTYTYERLTDLCVTLALPKILQQTSFAACALLLLSCHLPLSSRHPPRYTFKSTAQAFVNAAAISNILPALPHRQLHTLTAITMIAFKVLVAAALACVVAAHDTPHDSWRPSSHLCSPN